MKVKLTHRFLRGVVTLCLIMLSIITVGVFALAWHSGEQLSDGTVITLTGSWCGELLMSLLKRQSDNKHKQKQQILQEQENII